METFGFPYLPSDLTWYLFFLTIFIFSTYLTIFYELFFFFFFPSRRERLWGSVWCRRMRVYRPFVWYFLPLRRVCPVFLSRARIDIYSEWLFTAGSLLPPENAERNAHQPPADSFFTVKWSTVTLRLETLLPDTYKMVWFLVQQTLAPTPQTTKEWRISFFSGGDIIEVTAFAHAIPLPLSVSFRVHASTAVACTGRSRRPFSCPCSCPSTRGPGPACST